LTLGHRGESRFLAGGVICQDLRKDHPGVIFTRKGVTLSSENTQLPGSRDGLDSSTRAELAPDASRVRSHRVQRHEQVIGHLRVAEIARDQAENSEPCFSQGLTDRPGRARAAEFALDRFH
jgi:hypothetical protein